MCSPTPRFESRFRRTVVLDSALAEAQLKSPFEDCVSLDMIIECSSRLQATRESGPVFVHELIASSELIVDPPPVQPKVCAIQKKR